MTVWLKNSVTCSVTHFWSCVIYVNVSDPHLHHCQFHHCTPSQGEYCSQDQPSRLNTHNGIHHPQVRRYHADYMHSYIQLPTQEEWHECVLVCKVHGRQLHAGLRLFSSVTLTLYKWYPNTSTTVPSDSYRTFKIKSAIIFLSLLHLYMVSVYACY